MDVLRAYSTFVRACDSGSFSAVAREMGTSQSAVSKQIASLEESLGLQLFARTTRRLVPTAEALELYEHVRQLLESIEALRGSSAKVAVVRGTLRITAPNAFGRHRICPLLPQFLQHFAGVNIELMLSDHIADLVEEGLDMGIRVGNLTSSTLIARPLGIIEQQLVATPQYLATRGTPETPADLAHHSCILYGSTPRWHRWDFESELGRQVVDVTGPARINDPEAIYRMVLAHFGIALVPDWLVGEDAAKGIVRLLLPDYYPTPQPVSIVYPQTRFLSLRARSFIDFISAQLRRKS